MDEGVIRFECRWTRGPAPAAAAVAPLCRWRDRLHDAGLIGHDAEHDVGYGNASLRAADGALYVTGSQTGCVPRLAPEHVTRITAWDIDGNRLDCEGPVRASSESLTHLALYELGPAVGAVLHVHAPALYARLRDRVPTTDPAAAYGTPAIARAVAGLARAHPGGGLLVMGGHPDGLLAWGPDLEAAGRRLLAARADPSPGA